MLNQLKSPQIQSLSTEEARELGRRLGLALAPYTEEAESLRRMPPAAARLVLESGLMPMMRPGLYGGYEMDWMTLVDIVAGISRQSGSLGWCASFLLQHQWMLSYFPRLGQDHVYARDPNPAVVTSFAPSGVATKVEGGYRVSGVWSFGSGGDHCDWAVVGCRLAQPDPALPRGVWVLLKTGQFRIRDVWNCIGLKGSGSNDIVVDDAVVPDGFWLDAAAAMQGGGPSAAFVTSPIHRTGLAAQFQFALIAPLLGVVEGLFEQFVAANRDKISALGPNKVADNPLLQLKVGESQADIEAARAIIARLSERASTGELAGPDGSGEFLRGIGVASRLLREAADRLFNAAGARGLTEGSPMARHWRDAHAITNHVAFQPEGVFLPSGRAALGVA